MPRKDSTLFACHCTTYQCKGAYISPKEHRSHKRYDEQLKKSEERKAIQNARGKAYIDHTWPANGLAQTGSGSDDATKISEQVFAMTLTEDVLLAPSASSLDGSWQRQNASIGTATNAKAEPDGPPTRAPEQPTPAVPPVTSIGSHFATANGTYEKLYFLDLEMDLCMRECVTLCREGMNSPQGSKAALKISRELEGEEGWLESAEKLVICTQDGPHNNASSLLHDAMLERLKKHRKQLKQYRHQ
ncbi:uncharacterized protein LAESUDRAFT_717444, partial [Laetiporus sulphureus 93-53]